MENAKNCFIHSLKASTALVSLAVSQAIMAGQGSGAGSPAQGAQGSEDRLDEVVITARQMRPTDQTSATGIQMMLIETPQAITVITPEMLEVAGARSVYDAVNLIPGVQASGRGYSLDRIFMRGSIAFDHRVNGAALKVFQSLDKSMVDRIEVVRGPATVLYGVTSGFGGEINHILKSPTRQFKAQVGVEAGDWDLKRYEMDLSGPLDGDGRLRGRVVGVHEDYGVFMDVVDISNRKSSVLGSLAFDLTDRTTATLHFYDGKTREDPFDAGFLIQGPDNVSRLPTSIPAENYYFSDRSNSLATVDQRFLIGEVRHEFSNEWKLLVQGTRSEWDWGVSYFYPFGPAGAYSLPDNEVYLYTYDEYRDKSDLSLIASLGGEFEAFGKEVDFHVGLQHLADESPASFWRKRSVYLGTINIFQGGKGVLANGKPIVNPDRAALPIVRASSTDNSLTTYSMQFLVHATDNFKVLAGYLLQDADESSITTVQGTALNPPRTTNYKYKEGVPRLGITYDVADGNGALTDGKIYYSYSEGFSSNGSVFDNSGRQISKPQSMKQHEVGFKFETLGGRVGGAVAAYQSEIINQPVSASFLGGFATSGVVLEGQREIKGLEFEIVGALSEGWNLAANYSYTDSELSDPNYKFTSRIRSIPEHSAAVFSSYEWIEGPLAGLRVGGGVSYKSDYEFVNGLNRQPRFGSAVAGSYTRVDLYGSYRGFTGGLKGLEVFGNIENVTDVDYFMAKEDHPGFGIMRGNPRRITVGVRYNFN